jgi:hypothetical protein
MNQVYYYESRITTKWLQRASVTHIWGYHGDSSQFKSYKGINLTTRHTRVRRAPQVATVHNAIKESGRVLPRPSAMFHTYASTDTPWVARTLSHYTSVKQGKVSSSSSTHEATQFVEPHKIPYAPVYNSNLLIGARRSVLNRHRRGYHLGALHIRSDYFTSFTSSILHFSLIFSPGLILNHSIIYSGSQHSNLELGYKSHKSHEWSLSLDFYQSSIR